MNRAVRFHIQGRDLTLPIEVRRARQWAALFAVDADAAQRLVDPSGLRVARPLAGRAICTLAFVRYEDGDLEAYDEVGVTFLVRPHDAPPSGGDSGSMLRRRLRVYVHHLPVNRPFTLEAGRTIWGYPKFLAMIDVEERRGRVRWTLRHEGALVLRADLADGGSLRLPAETPPTYTYLDGMLRLTEWEARGRTRARPGGARIELGDHPIADELRSLGLPKRALLTTATPEFRVRFGAAQVVSAGPASSRASVASA